MSHPFRSVVDMTSVAPPIELRVADGRVHVEAGSALIERLTVTDPSVVSLLETAPEDDRADLALRILGIGSRGLTSMGIGIDLGSIDERVQTLVDSLAGEAEQMIRTILEESRASLGRQFDPEHRSSILARALAEFTAWRDDFLLRLDPAVEGSTATEFVRHLHDLVGPEGILQGTLEKALDLDSDDSAFARLGRSIDTKLEELRREMIGHRAAEGARAAEAERGTAHGLDFEDVVEANLRAWAAARPGSIVERTTTRTGELSSQAKVGDFVLTLADGRRIVVEAKRQATITLSGAHGILTELDAAMANRRAEVAVCVAGRDAFPSEVGHFNVYGNRILVVDEGDGAMTAIGLQWASSTAAALGPLTQIDTAAIEDRIDRIRKTAEQLSGARRTVTTMRTSLEKLHDHLGSLRSELLDQTADLGRLVRGGSESLGGDGPSS